MPDSYPENSPLAALGLAQEAPKAPESLAELMETARLLRIPPSLLATQPEAARRHYLARALAANPGLARFASENLLQRGLALHYAREGAAAHAAFKPFAAPEPEALSEPEKGQDAEADMPPLLEAAEADMEPDMEPDEAGTELAADDPAASRPDYYELARGNPEKALELYEGRLPDAASPDMRDPGLADYALDPFKNFANGWLDLARGIMGAGKSVPDLIGGRECALSKWFAKSIEGIKALEFETMRPESFGGRLAQDVVRNAPQLAAQIGTWIYAGAASSLGLIFSYIYGQDYLKHQEKGISDENAAFAGLVDAALQTAIEKLGLHALLKAPGLSSLAGGLAEGGLAKSAEFLREAAGRLQQGAAGQLGMAAARGAAIEGATEAVQHLPEYLTDYWAESSLYNSSLQDRLDWTRARALDAANLLQGTKDALYEGLVGAILGGAVGGVHGGMERRRIRQKLDPELASLLELEAQQAQAVMRRLAFEQAMGQARGQAAKMGDAAAARAIIGASLPENMQKAFLSASDLSALLGRDPRRAEAILEASGREVAEINEALASGRALEVDLASLLTQNTEEARLIQENLRLFEDGPTLGAASAWTPEARIQEVMRVLNQEDELEGFSEDERAQAAAEDAQKAKSMSSRVDGHIRRLIKEMTGAGLSSLEAQTNASLLRAHAMAWWKRYGVDAALLVQDLSISHADADLDSAPDAARRDIGGEELEREKAADDSPEWMSGKKPPRKSVRRGQLALSRTGALIRLFRDRDVSTVGHESGHLFLQDLIRISAAGETRVMDGFMDSVANLLGDDLDFAESLGSDLASIREQSGDDAQALREFAKALLGRARSLEGAEDKAEKGGENENNENADNADNDNADNDGPEAADAQAGEYAGMRAQAARRLARQARLSARWLEAARDARDDLKIFARHAGLDEASLSLAENAAMDLSIDDAASLQAFTSLHESTAKAFVSYLGEGKAPSPQTAKALARFAQWLGNLWRNYRDSGRVEISPELRGAFDRLLASDQDMRLQDSVDSLLRHEDLFLDNKNIKNEEAASLRQLLRRAQAVRLNHGEKLRRKKIEKWLRTRTAQIHKDLASDPFWLLAEKGRIKPADAASLLGEERAKKLMEASPSLFSKKAGPIDELASEAGYAEASIMLEELYERLALRHESRRGQAEIMAEDELKGRAAELGEDAYPLDADLEAYLEGMDSAVTRIVARLRFKNEAEIARWTDQSHVPQQLINSMAQSRLDNTPLRELAPASLERMLNRALAKRDRLLQSQKPGDLMKAMNQANEARIVYAMMQEAARAHRTLAKIRDACRKISQAPPGTHGARQTEALRQLLTAYGLGFSRAPIDYAHNRALSDLVKEITEAEDCTGSMMAFPDWLLQRRAPAMSERSRDSVIPVNLLSPRQLEDLFNLVQFLDKSGRGEMTGKREGMKENIKQEAQRCANAMQDLPDKALSSGRGIKDFFQNLADKGFAAVDILLWQMRKADGLKNIMGKGEKGGMETLWGRIIKGEEGVRSWTDKVYRAMKPHLEQLERCRERLEREYGRNMRLSHADGSPIRPPLLWRKAYHSDYYSAEMIFAMALHSGNASNMERLVSGYRGDDAIDSRLLYELFGDTRFYNAKAVLDPKGEISRRPGLLTAQDWRAIQGIWDAIALLWPDTKRVHQSMFGFAPSMIPPQSFEIQNADGSFSRLAGGYFPVKYDGRLNRDVAAWTEREEDLARNEAMFTAPSANRSFTKQRSRQAPGLPILLNLSPIGEHAQNAARFIELAPTVAMIDRISQRAEFREAYMNKFGRDDYDAIRPNLRGLLRTERLPDVIAWLEQRLRKYVVPWGLSWNPNVALIQSTAVFPAMGDLGHREIMSSMRQLILHPSLRKEIWKASPYMLSRMANLDQDLVRQLEFTIGARPASITWRGKSYSYNDLVDLGMKGIIIVDAAATCTVWLAAYRAKLNEIRDKGRVSPPEGRKGQGQGQQEGNKGQNQDGDEQGNMDADILPDHDLSQDGGARKGGQEDELSLNGRRGNPVPEDGAGGANAEDLIIGNRSGANPRPLPGPDAVPNSDAGPNQDAGRSGLNLIEFENAAHAEAVLYADTIVKQSNPDFDPSSRSSFLRSRGMMRLFNQFSSAITLFASRNHFMLNAWQKGRISKARYMRHLADDFLFPAAVLFLFFGSIRDFWDKEGNAAKSFTGLLMDQLSMSIPIFGSLATDISQNLLGMGSGNYRRGDLRTSLESPVALAKGASAAANKLLSKNLSAEEKKAAIYALMDLASFASRIPVSKVIRRADRGYEQYRRGEGTPFNIILPKPGK